MTKHIPIRQVILNIETTGLEPKMGHRIIEIAAVELLDRRISGKHFHRYINPDRTIDPGIQSVHGISHAFLQDKPKFSDIAQEFTEFVRGAGLVAHNAGFDIGFVDSELALLGLENLKALCTEIVDSLCIARDQRPEKSNSLNSLCVAYEIDVSKNDMHGALLDAHLLAEVYLAMTRGLLH